MALIKAISRLEQGLRRWRVWKIKSAMEVRSNLRNAAVYSFPVRYYRHRPKWYRQLR